MYNEATKVRFIRQYTTSINMANTLQSLFNAVEEYEKAWDADICTMSKQEVEPVVEQIVGLRSRSRWARIIMLRDYAKWCIVNKIQGANTGLIEMNITGVEKMRKQTISSPAHLQDYLNRICEPESEQTTDNIYRCYYWLAYGGLTDDDILKVRISDVDFSKMVVIYNNIEVPIYREAVPAFENCVKLTHFIYKNNNYTKDIYRERITGDTIIRGVRAIANTKSIRAILSAMSNKSRKEGKTDLQLSYFRVWISGIFFRAREQELMGIKPNFLEIVKLYNQKEYKLDSGKNTQKDKQRQLAKDWEEDYKCWKVAYNM